jgi:endonuclease/exonuclease/phosphatase family metal-dependent hydrolase
MRRIAILLAAIVVGVLVSTGVVMAASSSGSQQQTSSNEENTKVTVMSRNVYHGVDAEFAQAIAAPRELFFIKVAAVFNGYHQRNFPERAAGLAAEIEETQPDVVGLQEVVMVRTDTPADGPATPAEQVSLDYLQILLDKLQARGLNYAAVVQSINFDIEAPADENSDGRPDFDLRHTDRIAMLIRTDGKSSLEVLDKDSDHFQTTSNCKLRTASNPTQPIEIVRGWTSVDLSIQGKAVRFINTHLDGDCSDPAFQLAQAQEILDGPVQEAKDKNLPVVLLGDLNSKADGSGTPTYSDLLEVGFADAWAEVGRGSGFTCCQDDDLLNKVSHLSDRRDFVLFGNGSFQTTEVEVVGASPADRTPSGLWPSDHAGVAAKLRLLSENAGG